jgi:hypothetical protein
VSGNPLAFMWHLRGWSTKTCKRTLTHAVTYRSLCMFIDETKAGNAPSKWMFALCRFVHVLTVAPYVRSFVLVFRCVYFLMLYLTTLSVAQLRLASNMGWLMNNELQKMRKEIVIVVLNRKIHNN